MQIKQLQWRDFALYGGAIYANGTGQFIFNTGLVINNCSSIWGGGIYVQVLQQGSAQFNGVTFKDCNSTQDGGGLELIIKSDSDFNYLTGDITFDNCFCDMYGGGFSFLFWSRHCVEISTKFLFKNCMGLLYGGGSLISCYNPDGNIIMTGETTFINCSTQQYGAGTEIWANNRGTIEITGQKFKDCSSQYYGGAVYSDIQLMEQLIIRGLEIENLKNCTGRNGGGLFASIYNQGQVILDNCEFIQCTSNKGNGGGIYVNSDSLSTCQFQINDALIKECSANEDELNDVPPTGYGGGIFVTDAGDYDASSRGFNLKGLKMYGNTASRRGQSIYIAMTKVVEWCKLGIAGEYIKGNYSDGISNQHDLEGIPLTEYNFNQSTTFQINQQQNFLQTYWDQPKGSIWHISNRNITPTGNDSPGCALVGNPCNTIEYALKQISLEKEFSETNPTSEKRIGITEYGFDLNSPIQFKPSSSYTNVIKIMKQLYGTDEQMTSQAELKIKKGGDASLIEIGKQGWMSVIDGIKLILCYINIITDQSKLTIPIIYVGGFNSILELYLVIFSSINLSPTFEAKGIIHINVNNSTFQLQECIFQNIDIENEGGNVIRLLNEDKSNFTAIFQQSQFINISAISDSNGKGGSAIYAEIRDKSQIIIDDGCLFFYCVCSRGNGGAIYIDVDFTTQFEFLVNDTLIKFCQAKTDSTSTSPTGYGGGIFLTGYGDYDPQSNSLNFKGLNISSNSADNGGQNIYIIMNKLKEWCRYGTAGEYVKGNYSDASSLQIVLQGIPISFEQFSSLPSDQIQLIQKPLEYYWAIPQNYVWYIQSGTAQSIISEDQYWCGNIDEPCESIEYALKQTSIRIGGNETFFIILKLIGITEVGFELSNPVQFNPITSQTNNLTISNQLFHSSSMNDNSQLKIMKGGNDSNIENGKQGWMSVIDGIKLILCYINIITDQSKLTIPIIYVGGFNSILELYLVIFSSINLSPTFEAKGIIHINVNNSTFQLQECIFQNIDIENEGGNVIRLLNEDKSNFTAIFQQSQFINISAISDSNGKGGSAIYADIRFKSQIIIEDGCQFMHCICNRGNGGAIYIDVGFTAQFEFQIKDALIKECQAKADTTSSYPTGQGGGIFLAGYGDYDPQSNSLNFKGLNISNNSADNEGQSIYIIMSKLKEWCRYGTAGEYVKGNYSDAESNENELQGIPTRYDQFKYLPSDQIQLIQKPLKYYWALPQQDFWHIQSGTAQSIISEDQYWCGNIDEPCESIEYALMQISIRKGGNETSFISEKQIGITEVGFELSDPFEFNSSISHTNKVIITKQLYGTSSALIDNSQLKIKKGGNDSNIENGKQGWISLIQQGLQLQLYFINIITDQSKLTIPIIYVEGSNSILELNSVTFSGIYLSPTSEAKGIIHININNQQFNIQNCNFEDIQIENKGGNTIRLMNDNSFPFSSIIKNTLFKNINSICDSNGQGGSAIYAEIRDKTKIIFDNNCKFIQCVNNQGNGGAMYLDIDFESQFFFIINNTLIQECQAKKDSIFSYPTGYGGGIFLTGYGDYITWQNLLYLNGLKMYGNIADNGGQSIYVSMTNVVEWCKYGTDGEYVKGNYSDAYSNLSDIEGIAVNQSTFKILTEIEIQSQQQSLQYYWAHLATLSYINAVLNESNIDQPLHFIIKGSNMIPGKLYFQLTQNDHYINSFEMIYPPDDEITPSILIEGKPQSEQIATFGMKDYSWFDTSKLYSALISNDRKIFTGAEGKENQSIQLEFQIETPIDSPKGYKIAWWIILLIIVAGVILVVVVIIIIYLSCFRRKSIKKSKKNDQEEIEKQQIRQQTNEIEMNAEDERPQDNNKIKKNSSKPEHDEVNQLIQKEPYQKFNPQSSPPTISSPPTQQFQIQNPNQHSDQDLTPIDPSGQNNTPDKPSGSNIIPVNNSGINLTIDKHSTLNLTPDKPSGSILTPIDPSPSILSQSHHPTSNQQPIRSSSPGQSQKLQTARSLYPSHPNEPSKGLHSYRPRTNQLPVRSISGQLPAYKPSGQKTVNSSSKIQPLNLKEQQVEKKP
ncbi:MAG: hypothetical protein EZS28_019068 [Streblomastix strix]|uniref:Uncharacterized protein n=1 Tax=Streblomastix strix TaxID=222440 RepID=A0A5J4VS60_9EUKA|nr:MAG: hypothetical protein EZS28_019068 [Streblomastix strix]